MKDLAWQTYTLDEQKTLRGLGYRPMVNAEAWSDDDDGVCRQPMVWLQKTGQRCLAAKRTYVGSIAKEAMDALAKAGFLFPIPRNSGLYVESCCESAWLPVDDVDYEDEVWCCDERSDALWAVVQLPLASAEGGPRK